VDQVDRAAEIDEVGVLVVRADRCPTVVVLDADADDGDVRLGEPGGQRRVRPPDAGVGREVARVRVTAGSAGAARRRGQTEQKPAQRGPRGEPHPRIVAPR
jgi:hypothetical protein